MQREDAEHHSYMMGGLLLKPQNCLAYDESPISEFNDWLVGELIAGAAYEGDQSVHKAAWCTWYLNVAAS